MAKSLLAFSILFYICLAIFWGPIWLYFPFATGLVFLLWRALEEPLRKSKLLFSVFVSLQFSPLLLWKSSLGVGIPIGISFFTFHVASAVWDWRRGLVARPSLVDLGVYLLYFPKALAGPIERIGPFLDKVRRGRLFDPADRLEGLHLIGWGLMKQFLFVSTLKPVTSYYFQSINSPRSGWETLLVLYAFAIEFYCDFSAYTDLARGVSALLGISLVENFNRPYLAKNPQDFWQRWHISLSLWFRDYVYYPTFFFTKSVPFAIFLSFFLMGLWHGLSWNFALLGFYWAIILVCYSFLQPYLNRASFSPVWGRLLTLHLVFFAFLILRSGKEIILFPVVQSLSHFWWTTLSTQLLLRSLFVLVPVVLVEFILGKNLGRFCRVSVKTRLMLYAMLAYYIFLTYYFTEAHGLNDVRFLYFQF